MGAIQAKEPDRRPPPPRFDVVVGNPPFANAIEGGVARSTKDRLASRFPELGGTADLAYYFLALAHRIAAPQGAVGLVLPRGVLTARSTRRLRRELMAVRPPTLIDAPQDPYLFEGANVFVVLLALRPNAGCLGGRSDGTPRLEPIEVVDDNWWAPLIVADRRPRVGDSTPLGERFEVFASMTAPMAYDLLDFVQDGGSRRGLRLVTTGLIDPAVCFWGERTCRYLKRRFERPTVELRDAMPVSLKRRLEKVRRPKVLVAGLSNRVEAFLDAGAEYCGAVSTYTVLHPHDDLRELQKVHDYLNSEEASDCLRLELGAHALGGGRITLTKDFLRQLRPN